MFRAVENFANLLKITEAYSQIHPL